MGKQEYPKYSIYRFMPIILFKSAYMHFTEYALVKISNLEKHPYEMKNLAIFYLRVFLKMSKFPKAFWRKYLGPNYSIQAMGASINYVSKIFPIFDPLRKQVYYISLCSSIDLTPSRKVKSYSPYLT